MKKNKKESPVEITDKEAAFNLLKSKYKNLGRTVKVEPVTPKDCLPFPSLQMNILCNDGGIRRGSIVEYYGNYGTCKSWMCMELAKSAQLWRPDLSVAYYDLEYAFNPEIAEEVIGLDFGHFPDGRPKFDYWPDDEEEMPAFEHVLDRIYDVCASGIYSLVILDSLASTTGLWQTEQKSVTENKFGGEWAMPLSKGLKRIKAVCRKTGTILFITNQLREKQVFAGGRMVTKLESPGGNAKNFGTSHRLLVSWGEKDREGNDSTLTVFSEKVRYGRPWQKIEIPFTLGVGVNKEADILLAAENEGVVVKKGPYYYHDGSSLGQGKEAATEALRSNPALLEKIKHDTLLMALGKVDPEDTLLNNIDPEDKPDVVE